MKKLDQLKSRFFISFLDDWVALWELIRMVKKIYGFNDREKIQSFILEFIHNLLINEMIYVGFPTEEGKFDSWQGKPETLIQRIKKAWDALGDEPNIGDVIWFDITKKGEQELQRLCAMEHKQSGQNLNR